MANKPSPSQSSFELVKKVRPFLISRFHALKAWDKNWKPSWRLLLAGLVVLALLANSEGNKTKAGSHCDTSYNKPINKRR